MRTVSEQELKDILDKHGKWLRKEEGGERANLALADLALANLALADLRFADLRSSNLRFANLRYADLSSADLHAADISSADLYGAKLRGTNLLMFNFNRDQAFFTLDGTLTIGCKCMPINEWVLRYEEIGAAEGYSSLEIMAYGDFIKSCERLFLAEAEKEALK